MRTDTPVARAVLLRVGGLSMNERTLAVLISILAFASQPTSLGAPAVDRFQTASVAAQLESSHVLGVMP